MWSLPDQVLERASPGTLGELGLWGEENWWDREGRAAEPRSETVSAGALGLDRGPWPRPAAPCGRACCSPHCCLDHRISWLRSGPFATVA